MNGFQNRDVSGMTSDGRNFTFTSPVTYISNDGRAFVIPGGASTDGASTPKIMWDILPPFGDYWLAAALHDAAYRNTLINQDGSKYNLTKDQSDSLLFEAMKSLGVCDADCKSIYEGVHLFGWKSFQGDR